MIYSQWERTSGPEGNSIYKLANISGKIYAGTHSDGIYQTTDEGVSWFPKNTGIEFENIRGIVQKSGNLYAGSFDNGVFHSTNGGNSWIPPASQYQFGVHDLMVKDNYIFAASEGLYRSSDDGDTWELSPYIFQFFQTALCFNGDNLFAGSFSGLQKSTDNGETWVRLLQFESRLIWSLYSKDSMVLVGSVNRIYRSTDRGNTFDEIQLPIAFNIVNVYSFASAGSALFMATSYDGVYKSTDNGLTWSPAIQGMGAKNVRALTGVGSTVIAGTYYSGMFRSTDTGSSWQRANSGLSSASTIDEILSDGRIVYAGTRDGVFQSADNGRTWIRLAGSSDTINYGTISGMCLMDGILFVSARYHFNSTVFRWKNQTWDRVDNGLPPDLTFIFGMTTSGHNILAGTDNGVYYSTDSGNSWQLTNLPSGYPIDDITSSGNGYVYAIVTNTGIYRSSNDGIDWSFSFMSTSLVDLSAFDNYGFTCGFNFGVFFTFDSGNTWGPSQGIGAGSVYGVEKAGNGMILAATEYEQSRIWISYDNGISFSPFSEGLEQNAVAENFAVTDSFMFAGMDYNGIWKRLKPGLTNVISQTNEPESFSLEQNFPNPFNPETNIRFSIPEKAFVNISVYDLLGRKLETLINENKGPGYYTVQFDGTGYPSGIYFYKIVSENFSEVKKMILTK